MSIIEYLYFQNLNSKTQRFHWLYNHKAFKDLEHFFVCEPVWNGAHGIFQRSNSFFCCLLWKFPLFRQLHLFHSYLLEGRWSFLRLFNKKTFSLFCLFCTSKEGSPFQPLTDTTYPLFGLLKQKSRFIQRLSSLSDMQTFITLQTLFLFVQEITKACHKPKTLEEKKGNFFRDLDHRKFLTFVKKELLFLILIQISYVLSFREFWMFIWLSKTSRNNYFSIWFNFYILAVSFWKKREINHCWKQDNKQKIDFTLNLYIKRLNASSKMASKNYKSGLTLVFHTRTNMVKRLLSIWKHPWPVGSANHTCASWNLTKKLFGKKDRQQRTRREKKVNLNFFFWKRNHPSSASPYQIYLPLNKVRQQRGFVSFVCFWSGNKADFFVMWCDCDCTLILSKLEPPLNITW